MNPLDMDGAEPPPPGVKTAAAVRWVIIGVAIFAAFFSLFLARRGGAGATAGGEGHEHGGAPTSEGTSAPPAEESSGVPGRAEIDLTTEKLQRIGVRTARVELREIADPVRTVATISADLTRIARVQTRFSGWIESVAVSAPGVRVKKGDVLATIFSREIYTSQEELLDARKWPGEDGPRLLESARQRLILAGVADEDVKAVEEKGSPIRALPIRAPIGGFVTTRGVVQGASVDTGTELFQIADLTRVSAWIDVYERDVAALHPGLEAELTFPSLPGRHFRGTVSLVDPRVDPVTRTLKVRVDLANGDLALKPGMYGDATLATAPRSALVVPTSAVVDTGDRQYVFVQRTPGRFAPRTVHTGGIVDGVSIVLSGLAEREDVVASGNFLLDSESRLRAATAQAASGPARTDIPIDREKFPDKYRQWLDCERVHRGMGAMEEDCKNAIPKPWK